jgi:hypothetical protein
MSDLMRVLITVAQSCELGSLVKTSKKYKYESLPVWADNITSLPIYITAEENKTYRTRKYLCKTLGGDAIFINRNPRNPESIIRELDKALKGLSGRFHDMKDEDKLELYLEVFQTMLQHFELNGAEDMDAVEVPSDFKLTDLEEEEVEEEEEEKVIKKKERPVIEVRAKVCQGEKYGFTVLPTDMNMMRKINLPEVFIGTQNEDDLKKAAFITRICNGNPAYAWVHMNNPLDVAYDKEQKQRVRILDKVRDQWKDLLQVTPSTGANAIHLYPQGEKEWGSGGWYTGAICLALSGEVFKKLCTRYYTFPEFFCQFDAEKQSIRMSNILSQWYTARLIAPVVYQYRFLYHMESLFPDWSRAYRKLHDHWSRYFIEGKELKNIAGETSFDQILLFADKIATLQKEVLRGADEATVVKTARELFKADCKDAHAFDAELITIAENMEQLASLVAILGSLKQVGPDIPISKLSITKPAPFTHEEEMAVREYIALKNINPDIQL